MIYSEQILQSTLESLSRRELRQIIDILKDKTPIDDYADFGIKRTLEVAEDVLYIYNQEADEAHEDHE